MKRQLNKYAMAYYLQEYEHNGGTIKKLPRAFADGIYPPATVMPNENNPLMFKEKEKENVQ